MALMKVKSGGKIYELEIPDDLPQDQIKGFAQRKVKALTDLKLEAGSEQEDIINKGGTTDSGLDNFLAATGGALAQQARGVQQFLTSDPEKLKELGLEEAEYRKLSAPLENTGAGVAGEAFGRAAPAVATMAAPLGLAKAGVQAPSLLAKVAPGLANRAAGMVPSALSNALRKPLVNTVAQMGIGGTAGYQSGKMAALTPEEEAAGNRQGSKLGAVIGAVVPGSIAAGRGIKELWRRSGRELPVQSAETFSKTLSKQEFPHTVQGQEELTAAARKRYDDLTKFKDDEYLRIEGNPKLPAVEIKAAANLRDMQGQFLTDDIAAVVDGKHLKMIEDLANRADNAGFTSYQDVRNAQRAFRAGAAKLRGSNPAAAKKMDELVESLDADLMDWRAGAKGADRKMIDKTIEEADALDNWYRDVYAPMNDAGVPIGKLMGAKGREVTPNTAYAQGLALDKHSGSLNEILEAAPEFKEPLRKLSGVPLYKATGRGGNPASSTLAAIESINPRLLTAQEIVQRERIIKALRKGQEPKRIPEFLRNFLSERRVQGIESGIDPMGYAPPKRDRFITSVALPYQAAYTVDQSSED